MRPADLSAGALSDQQVRSIAEAQARVNVWEGSIRSGKTVGSLLRWLMHVAHVRDLPGELFMFGRTRDSIARNVFGPLRDRSLFGPLARQVDYTTGAATATILGQTVHVLGANDKQAEEKVRGLTGKGAYGDELTTVPAPFFRQSLGRLSVKGAKLYGTTNPDNPAHWLRQDYLLDPALDLRSWHFTIDDNPHLDPDYVRNIKAEYKGLWFKRFILGQWVQAEGAIYEMFDEDEHVVDELPAIERVLAAGVDYGTTNPFAALMLATTRDGRLVFTREYRHDPRTARRQLTDAEFSRELRRWLDAEGEARRPKWLAIDPSAESFQLQLHRDQVRGIADADNSVGDGIRLFASLLATRRLIIHKSCRGLIDEIPGYVWDDTAADKGEDRPVKKNDHSCDAARYAISTTRAAWQRSVPITPWVSPQ
ncbi:PBSX family phage terminase large subunit [Pseudonocardia sp. McavD-2-B]|uniref:PBSX family phage terminase large subunit n=1 Tax=Pseudonocardia sp. McavD-2-B TaxID=2954499 RepID=UPI0020979C1B|nr:PBSX family phage terminase large subunit [Pseudonocardia sp. McavD-2-B]MCO7195401.1 PBSX family phage terminase large subunit [Pseudonocardia sp. McavD-2-B]